MLDPNALIYIPYPRVDCLKTIPFTAGNGFMITVTNIETLSAAHTYIAHI